MFGIQNWINVGIASGIAMMVLIAAVIITILIKNVKSYLVAAYVFIAALIITIITSLLSPNEIVGNVTWILVFVFATAGLIYFYLYKEKAKKRGIQI
jgi:hypothetical protein